jgi:hypothetical protein
VNFGENIRKKGRVLGGEGYDPKPPEFFWDTDIFPSHFALTSIASFLSGPEESPTSFIDGFVDTGRKEARTHGMGQHRGEDRVDEEKTTSNGEASPSPAREAHITF